MSVEIVQTAIEFTVYGLPQSAGSKRHVGGGRIIDSNRKARGWKSEVAARAIDTMGTQTILVGPLAVEFAFYVPRPAAHYSTHGGLLRSAPMLPTKRPDVLKLARAVEDALTGIAWRDDAQIVTETLTKRFDEPARVEVRIVRELVEL